MFKAQFYQNAQFYASYINRDYFLLYDVLRPRAH